MRPFSSSPASPGIKSTSIPRAARISAARGLRASAINTFGMDRLAQLSGFGRVTLLVPGPVEPRQQQCYIGGLDRRARPDPQTRRRGAMTGDVIGRAFVFEPPGHRPGGTEAVVPRHSREPWIDDLELRRGRGDRRRVLGKEPRPRAGLDPGLERREALLRAGHETIQ